MGKKWRKKGKRGAPVREAPGGRGSRVKRVKKVKRVKRVESGFERF